MAYTKAQLEAIKNTLLASNQPILASQHRSQIQSLIDEMYDGQSRGNILVGVQSDTVQGASDTFLIFRSGQAYQIPLSLFSATTLQTLGDVFITDLQNGDSLVYNLANDRWENQNILQEFALFNLIDVELTTPANGDILIYDSTSEKWENESLSTLLGDYVTIDTTQTITGAKTFSLDTLVNGLTIGRGGGNISSNTANGYESLFSNTTGFNNTANGFQALFSNTTGFRNTANGHDALRSNTTGVSNTANGHDALRSNTTGGNNTANGFQALFSNTTGFNNTANGFQALFSNTTGGNNTANGYQALFSNTIGGNNTANGYQALFSNTTGFSNTANGRDALRSNTTGFSNTANGHDALRSNTTGGNNTANGYQAGRYIANKSTAATILNNSIMLGFRTSPLADNQTNQIVIGYDAIGEGSNTATLGNTSIVKTILRGTINAANLPTSSAGLIAGDIYNDGGTLKIV